MSPDFVYSKAPEWEIRTTPETYPDVRAAAGPGASS